MFIVLTGENWNEIMIHVIDNYGRFFGPACLFIILMMIGNFMLLNLFLAILLKSISNDHDSGEGQADNAEAINSEVEQQSASNPNDSVSNIEEEVEQIMNDLMLQSPKMRALQKINSDSQNIKSFKGNNSSNKLKKSS